MKKEPNIKYMAVSLKAIKFNPKRFANDFSEMCPEGYSLIDVQITESIDSFDKIIKFVFVED